ncbi:MAG: malto-oligosyltrehalose synthase [Thermoleophilia bacterium]|nr:malto-oligosyltrehalose synthase [Thermoleophilia bacterium]
MAVPCSTYRLQMTSEFGFVAAREVVPYLERLGVTDVYCSPLLQAAPGSTHGYDVADPTRLDSRLGTRAEFDAFSDELRSRDMGLVLDIVPNHMAASSANPWWRDVLQSGPQSRYAWHFDIDWVAGDGRLLLPVLGAPLEEVLAAGDLRVEGDELVYFDTRLPVAPGTAGGSDIASVVAAQHYELADWREQSRRLNYRRFFDITGLVGMRVERAEVFEDLHALIFELVREGRVTGIRVDHVDGLHDPCAYLEQLQARLRAESGRDEPFWVVVEKILAGGEHLRADWPVAGTTGYHFLDACDGVFVDADGAERMAQRYAEVAAQAEEFDDVVAAAKLRIIRDSFWGELTQLAQRVLGRETAPVAEGDDDVELHRVRDALAVVTAQLDVYRTYVDHEQRSAEDDHVIEAALAGAAAHAAVDPLALAAVAKALREDVDVTMRWQQFSGPVTAKSVEDTAFYRYHAVDARNEVGAHPSHPAAAVGSFHWLLGALATDWPASMNASSTHDTKRSEDVRARLLTLTQRPDEWADAVDAWINRYEAPDRNDAWMVAGAIVGAWPLSAQRLEEYVRKAVREEKLRTSWTDPDSTYEDAIIAFAEQLRGSGQIEPFVSVLIEPGRRAAVASVALKLFAPGVPDTYQGTEVESLALVDPDNRRPVDFAQLEAWLDTDAAPDKLSVVAGALRARRANRELFATGGYVPLRADGHGVVAYARHLGDAWALVAAARPGFQAGATGMLQLPDGAPREWTSVVTGTAIDLHAVPVAALLARGSAFLALGGSAVHA